VYARGGERLGFVDCEDTRGRMRTCHDRRVPRASNHDVGGEATFADDEPAILAHAAVARHKTE
jgi:hypothetical protein